MTDIPDARSAPPTGSSAPLGRQQATPEAVPAARDPLRRTRASATWMAVIVFAVVMVLLLIFILQNTQSVEISFFTATGHLPLAVAMLLAAVAGVLLAAIAATLRIWQLRRLVRRSTHQ